jgi:hypothetical protein
MMSGDMLDRVVACTARMRMKAAYEEESCNVFDEYRARTQMGKQENNQIVVGKEIDSTEMVD